MNRIIFFLLLSLIISCSTSSSDDDLFSNNTTNSVGINNDSNSSSGNDQNNNSTGDNSSNNNSNDSSGNNNNSNDNSDSNSNDSSDNNSSDSSDNNNDTQSEINSVLFDKWNFGSYSDKFGKSKDEIDFIILKSDYQYILNLKGEETRGEYDYSNGVINLYGKGNIVVRDYDSREFNFQLNLNSGNEFNIISYSDNDYSDGDCTTFLECTHLNTYTVNSDRVYFFLKNIFQDEFFYFRFINDPDNIWIEVLNSRKIVKISALLDFLVDGDETYYFNSNDFSTYDYSSLSYGDLIDEEWIDVFNANCEEDFTLWTNKIENKVGENYYDAPAPLNENSFRNLNFSVTDILGREIMDFNFKLNPDGSITMSYLPPDPDIVRRVSFTFREFNLDFSTHQPNICVTNDIPFSEINIGFEFDEDVFSEVDPMGMYNMFTFWTFFICALDLCDDSLVEMYYGSDAEL